MNQLFITFFILVSILNIGEGQSHGELYWKVGQHQFVTFKQVADDLKLEFIEGSYRKIVSDKVKIEKEDSDRILCFLNKDFISKDIFNSSLIEFTHKEELLILKSGEDANDIVFFPFYKLDDSYIDKFIIDDEISEAYEFALRESNIDPSSVCRNTDCLTENSYSTKYLAIADWEYSNGFNYLMDKKSLEIVSSASNLQKIFFYGIKIEKLPSNWNKLTQLEELHMLNCDLEKFDLELPDINKLTTLNLSGNLLEEIALGGNSLTYINLANNQISDLAFSPTLISLTDLIIANNQVEELNLFQESCNSLIFLDLRNNYFGDLYTDPLKSVEHVLFNGNISTNIISSDFSRIKTLGLNDFSSEYCSGIYEGQFDNLEQLYITKASNNFKCLRMPNLIHLAFEAQYDNVDLTIGHEILSRLQTLTLPSKHCNVLLNLPSDNQLHTLSFTDYDYKSIRKTRLEYPDLTMIYYDYDDNIIVSYPLSDQESSKLEYWNREGQSDMAAFNFFHSRNEDLIVYLMFKDNKYIEASTKNRIFIKARVADIISMNSKESFEHLDFWGLSQNDELNLHESIVALSRGLSHSDKKELMPLIQRSSNVGIAAYGALYNNKVSANNELLDKVKKLDLKSIDTNNGSANTADMAKMFLTETEYYNDLSDANNYGKSLDEYSNADNNTALYMAGATAATYAIAGIQKIVSKNKAKKAKRKKAEVESAKKELKKIYSKLEKFVLK